MTKEDLGNFLKKLNTHKKEKGKISPLWLVAMNGHCDAFALSLVDFLEEQNVASEIIIISRERFNKSGRRVEKAPISHVVVKAFGETWDFEGPRALERREEDWEGEYGFDDEFFSKTVTRSALEKARQKESGGQGVNQDKVVFFKKAFLSISATPKKPSKNQNNF